MLSYLHEFHAGNFADVHKHASLILTLAMMQAKPSAIAGFDTHAGSAMYDLAGERAKRLVRRRVASSRSGNFATGCSHRTGHPCWRNWQG